MKRISIFLITTALIAGMVGCGSQSYALAIASTAGGSVTTPGEGMFTYEEGAVVNLTVEAEAGYRFINWTGDVGTITNVEASTATITMNGSYFITASFAAIPPIQYNLTISSTSGGAVIAPGEGTFTYDKGTVVNLVAEFEEGYRFTNWSGHVDTIANVEAAETTITMDDSYSITANFGEDISMVVARDKYTVGLKSDGTVVAVGDNDGGQCDVGDWTDIVRVAAGDHHTVGVKSDGTVVAVGRNDYGQCDVGDWTDIVQVAAGCDHTVGIRSDGTVVAVGDNFYGQCDVGGWTDIVQVAAGCHHTVGLKSDGTVAIVGIVGGLDDWTHIVQVAAAFGHTVGLKSDGTVVDTGYNVSGWTDIVQVATDRYHTVGLKSDGSLVSVGNNSYGQCSFGGWTDIVQVAAGYWHTVGLKSDGTVVAVGNNGDGQCDVGDWTLN
jgi:preprotein translocase subunit YajC